MLLTTTTIKRSESTAQENILKGTKRALNIAKETGEIVLLLMGFVDSEKYKDIIQTKYNRE